MKAIAAPEDVSVDAAKKVIPKTPRKHLQYHIKVCVALNKKRIFFFTFGFKHFSLHSLCLLCI